MHSDEIHKLDRIEIFENKKNNKTKRFLEVKLFNLFGCNKKNINFEKFKSNITKAIKNEKYFCEDIAELKEKLGSNVGTLLDEMINIK